jgi:hypothetical protein
MSYCRFSSDNFKSDVYVYESCYGGFDVHVAGNRIASEIPPLYKWNEVSSEEYFKRHNEQIEAVRDAESKSIGGVHDGGYFNFSTLEELLEFLNSLPPLGYHVPGYVIEVIKKKITQSLDNPPTP